MAAEPSTLVMLARGLGRRCPRCGQARLFLYPFARTTFLAVDLLMHRMERIDH